VEPYQILLLILVIIVFAYVSVGVYVTSMMVEFSSRLKKRMRGLNLLLYERSVSLSTIAGQLSAKGVAFTASEQECFNALSKATWTSNDEESFFARVEMIKEATSKIRYLCQANPKQANGAIIVETMGLLEDLEANYRIYIGQYNMDVVGYNYWIKIPTYRWWAYVLRHRKKSLLS